MKTKSVRLGIILALMGGICWGFSGVSADFLFDERGVTAPWLVSVRMTVGGLVLLAYAMMKPEIRKNTFKIWTNRHDAMMQIVYCIFGMAACQLTYFMAVQASNAGTATSIQFTYPVMVMVLVSLRDKKRPRYYEVAALAMVVTGVFLIATNGSIGSMVISTKAVVWALISAFTCVLYNFIPVGIIEKYGTVPVVAWGMLVSGIGASIFVHPWHVVGVWDGYTYLTLAGVVILGTIIAFCAYMEGMHQAGAKLASIFAASEPLSATLLSALIMGVPLTVASVFGLLLIIAAVTGLSILQPEK